VSDLQRGDAEAELDLLQRLLALEGDVRGGLGRGASEEPELAERELKAAGDLGDEGVVVEIAGGGEDHVAGVKRRAYSSKTICWSKLETVLRCRGWGGRGRRSSRSSG
jgi:hypothetical protein